MIKGIPVTPHQHLKIAMFADDVLIFSNSPASDMIALKGILDEYRLLSGLKINYSKSEILLLTQGLRRPWLQSSPFAIATKKIKYLGIWIGTTSESIYALNYDPPD